MKDKMSVNKLLKCWFACWGRCCVFHQLVCVTSRLASGRGGIVPFNDAYAIFVHRFVIEAGLSRLFLDICALSGVMWDKKT